MNKRATLPLIAILTLSSLLIVGVAPASAAVPKPVVPEFTLKIVARPFDVPPAATVDPYTGQTVITHGGYHVENKSIDITIKNQPGDSILYQIRFKGHYESDWKVYWKPIPNTAESNDYVPQSDGDYTVISVPINNDELNHGTMTNFPEGGEVDFQVRALNGYFEVIPRALVYYDFVQFNGEKGDWSNTQTIKIGKDQTSTPSTLTAPTETSTTIQLVLGGTCFILRWEQIVMALIVAVAILLATIAVLVHKVTAK